MTHPAIQFLPPPGWEVASQVDILEPLEREPVPLLLNAQRPKPRANAVIRVRASDHSAPPSALMEIVRALAQSMTNFHADPLERITFEDGGTGVGALVRFNRGQMRIAQRHIMRIDAGMLGHIALTADEASRAKLDTLLDLARSYRPGGGR